MVFGTSDLFLHFGDLEYGLLMDLNVCIGKSRKKDL